VEVLAKGLNRIGETRWVCLPPRCGTPDYPPLLPLSLCEDTLLIASLHTVALGPVNPTLRLLSSRLTTHPYSTDSLEHALGFMGSLN
jgi:hypothetical protein